ncbi:MAG: putative lipid II flippase FtsW [Clostridia bacterium]|nr:putative lipid II flippase FtsW [Clostridia bacterium]
MTEKRKQLNQRRQRKTAAPVSRKTGVVSHRSRTVSKSQPSMAKVKRQKTGTMDYYLFTLLVILLSFGLIMVFSASSINAFYEYGNSYHYLLSQGRWVIIGFVVMMFFSRYDYHKLAKQSPLLVAGTIVLLLLVLAVGTEVKGAKRWLGFGGASIQPSECAKIVLIIFLSYRLSMEQENKFDQLKGLTPYLLTIALFCGLVLAEKHLSGTVVLGGVGILLLLAGGAKMAHFGLGVLGAFGLAVLAIIQEPYRLERITTFWDPFAHKMDEGWQIVQSLYAIGSGGLFGVGLGRSRQKYLYIPEPQNDFIFSIICEELGWLGALLVLTLFALLIWRGMKIALNAPDKLGSLLAFGLSCLVAIQVMINVAVVTASMPVTGMQLPFFSAGGSSLVFLLWGMGILLNISRQCKK